jgi:uncharacterized protein DUF6636
MAMNTRSRLAAMSVGAATVVALVGCSSPGTTTSPGVTTVSGTPPSAVTVTVKQPASTVAQSAPPSNRPDVSSPAPELSHADEPGLFLSPSGNIICGVGTTGSDGKSGAMCEIRDFIYAPPSKPLDCHLGWGDRISLDPGSAPALRCHGDTQFGLAPGQPTLPYGQTRSAGTITCDSEPSGMTCTDSSTGHYFRMSRESLEIG